MLALIDGDIVVYSAGFANVERSYTTEDGSVFRYKKEAVAHCKDKGLDTNNIERVDSPGEEMFAFANAKRIINKILEKTECDDYVVYLTGDASFRKQIDPEYKAHRDGDAKPPYFESIREYLIREHGAIVTGSGLEADDYIGMAAAHNTVICTLDKDLDQIQGRHFNWRSEEDYYISSEEGELWFWMQMLIGDTADNIKGIRGIGPAKAYALLDGLTVDEMRCKVGLYYAMEFDDPEKKYKDNAQLLYIMR